MEASGRCGPHDHCGRFASTDRECRVADANGKRIASWPDFRDYFDRFSGNEAELQQAPADGRFGFLAETLPIVTHGDDGRASAAAQCCKAYTVGNRGGHQDASLYVMRIIRNWHLSGVTQDVVHILYSFGVYMLSNCGPPGRVFFSGVDGMGNPVLVRMARGEVDAVRDCVEEFGGLVWAIARRMSKNGADAEDAVQEIFVDLWRSAARYDATQGSEKVFVATLARRRLIDRLRRSQRIARHEVPDDGFAVSAADYGTAPETHVDAVQAATALARLRPDQRDVLRMGILEGMSHSEIASATGMPLGTVKTQIRRGLIQVRRWLRLEASPELGGATL
jgi:RNA polymerase sigma-70 factor (ECF subfamily)